MRRERKKTEEGGSVEREGKKRKWKKRAIREKKETIRRE